MFVAALSVAAVGGVVAVWLAWRPLDSAAWGGDIGLGRLAALLASLPVAVAVLVWDRVRA